MSPVERNLLVLTILAIAAAYVASGVWLWRTCETAPMDPDDVPESAEALSVMRYQEIDR